MFRKIIVGVDGLQGGRDAVALAQALAPRAELILVSAYPFDTAPSRFALLGYGNRLREETEEELKRTAQEAGADRAQRIAVANTNPARALHRVAESEGADLIVIGTAHHGAVGRVLLGDVARGTLHGAPCPVAVAPHRAAPPTVSSVGVAYDGSDEARLALAVGADLAAPHDARLRVLQVVEPFTYALAAGYPMDLDVVYEEIRSDAQRALEAEVADLPVAAEARALIDTPAVALAAFAREVDVLVLGSRSFGPVRRVVLGSMADRLVHHATAPVIVVPRGAHDTSVIHDRTPGEAGVA